MASKALKHHHHQRFMYDEGPKFSHNSQESRMRGYVPIYRNHRRSSITDQRTEREHVRAFFGEGSLPYNGYSLVSSPYSSEYPTRTNSFRRISPSHQYRRKRTAPAPPPHLMHYNSLPNNGPSREFNPNVRRHQSQKKRQAPPPPEHLRKPKPKTWILIPPKDPPLEPPADYEVEVDNESSPSNSPQGIDSGMEGNSRSPSPETPPPVGYSDIASARPPTPPPLPPIVCEVKRSPKPPSHIVPPPKVAPPPLSPLTPLQYRNLEQEYERDGLSPALKAQLLEAARKRLEEGPIIIKKQDPFHERFARELKKAFEMRQKRLLKGTIKMKFQHRNTVMYKACDDSDSPPVTPLEKPVVPKKPINGSEVLLESIQKVEKVAKAEMQQRLNGQGQSSDASFQPTKKVSWTPAHDLNGEVFEDDDDKENAVDLSSRKADFYEMLYGKSATAQKQKHKKKDSSSSQESDYIQGSLRKLKKSVKKGVKNAFGSLRGSKSRQVIDESIQTDDAWQIYPACMYDESNEGPINIVRVEKGPAYAYHPEKGQLVLIPDYDNIIVTDDGRKIREAHIKNDTTSQKKVAQLVEAKLSSVESPGALAVPTPLRDHKPSIIEERHTQDVIEMQFQQVQGLNKQFKDDANPQGLDNPAWNMVKNPRARISRSDRADRTTSWDTVYSSVRMTVDGSLMYCDPNNDFKEADENVVHLNAPKAEKKYGQDYGDIVPVSKPMVRVLRKGWKAYKDNSESWDLTNGNPLYASDEEDEQPDLKLAKSEPMFHASDDSGYERGSNSTGNTPLDEVPTSLQYLHATNSCPNSPDLPKHQKERNGTVLPPLACGYTVSPEQSINAVAGMKGSPTPSLLTPLDTGLNNSGIRQNTVINTVISVGNHRDHR
ncbi:hypothetical protein CAPTEDRAFT_223558 [Capitella teleta]|uniref:Uncharacterized protein n=1 Tax=Capitella teleta TaxID=283909 RepID=R7UI24_CAPTE|nr:hypothetical protein CAPTEDRAFT_223558 [Capitella teleta]|eukprot:ELU05753.1 hypothetical protein CAPTEDRAFT_223558 [Capitella teleta]